MEGSRRWFISRDRRVGRLKTLANPDRPAGCWKVWNREGHDVVSACGSQLRWATAAPTEFASRRPAGARSPLLPPSTTPSTTVTILPDARGKRLYPPLTFGELRRFPAESCRC